MEAYRHPAAMETLLPKERGARLSEVTCEILKASGRLTGQAATVGEEIIGADITAD